MRPSSCSLIFLLAADTTRDAAAAAASVAAAATISAALWKGSLAPPPSEEGPMAAGACHDGVNAFALSMLDGLLSVKRNSIVSPRKVHTE